MPPDPDCYIAAMSIQVFGLPVSRGVAIGRAVLVASSRVDVAHYFVQVEQVEGEIERVDLDVAKLKSAAGVWLKKDKKSRML